MKILITVLVVALVIAGLFFGSRELDSVLSKDLSTSTASGDRP